MDLKPGNMQKVHEIFIFVHELTNIKKKELAKFYEYADKTKESGKIGNC